ncbi:MAG: hypothetical protein IT437_11615 [Phycisphaerales bacterium]|nr:hypothetical protein [Phycisphaerales bacterium]
MATVRALFIGNSFTARNDVPGLIAAMAKEKGHTLTSRLISRGGASLKMHFNKGDATKAIESGDFDTVVLQEQSTLPVKNAERFHENVRLFDPVIRAAKARMVLYLTWARRHSPQNQALLTDAYASIGNELKAVVAPAGVAWQRVLRARPDITLHDKDDSHPTLAGSYLAACVLFATLFGESPVGTPAPDGIPPGDAQLLQAAAWQSIAP